MLQLPRVGVCELLHSRAVVLSWHTKSAVTASNSTLWFETTAKNHILPLDLLSASVRPYAPPAL